jgi:3-hydroxybutyryl-CoA dehydrogenase
VRAGRLRRAAERRRSARIDSAIQTITKNLTRQVQRGIIKQADMDAALKRIKGAPLSMAIMAPCDLVIESIVEQDEAKRKVFSI